MMFRLGVVDIYISSPFLPTPVTGIGKWMLSNLKQLVRPRPLHRTASVLPHFVRSARLIWVI
jgi:hypothetical protein